MKKHIILCLTFLLSACSLFNYYDKEFKNPIFYQPIQNTLYYSRGATEEIIIYTYLTPTSFTFKDVSKNIVLSTPNKCDIIENEQDKVTLKCKVDKFGEPAIYYLQFKIKNTEDSDCTKIVTYLAYNDIKKLDSHISGCVVHSDKQADKN
ncbi:MAG: hypothetical protein J6K16_00490 [Alphaproteobacteria bacterium]|nr:hypothetical protein [Alphaproteobacteria bacterium]